MSTVRVTKEFTFEMAHSLLHYDGPCRHIHGHSYRLFVCVSGSPIIDTDNPKNGMLIDFGDLKEIVHREIISRFDHCTVFSREAYNENAESINVLFSKIEIMEFQPTCENFVIYFAQCLSEKLPVNVSLHSLQLYETATSFAEWFASDNN